MTTWTSLFPDEAVLLKRQWFKAQGAFSVAAPNGANFGRVMARGCGGQGANWGGGGAYARAVFPVKSANEAYNGQVGQVQTATVAGDTWLKRLDGTILVYADRGRGNTTAGLAVNSVGDVTYDGQAGVDGTGTGGKSYGDVSTTVGRADYAGNMPETLGADSGFNHAAGPGGGGHLNWNQDANGVFLGYTAWGAGRGLLCIEWFDAQPHY